MHYTFVINPHAHSELGQTHWNTIEPVLKEKQISYDVHFTKYQKHSTKIVRKLCADGKEHTLVVLGGDGSLNEAINGIDDFSKITLGYIPTGSGNDFARDLKLPTNPLKALHVVLHPKVIRKMDVGRLTFENKQRNFAVSAGIGFDADICHHALVSPTKMVFNRLRMGQMTYTGIAISQLALCTPSPMDIVVNDNTYHYEKVYFASVMNRKYEGGGFLFCPKAKDDDGKLDIIVVEGIAKPKLLALLPAAFYGKHANVPGVHIFCGKKIAIHSSKPLPVHTDGEPIFLKRSMEAICEPKQLNVICS